MIVKRGIQIIFLLIGAIIGFAYGVDIFNLAVSPFTGSELDGNGLGPYMAAIIGAIILFISTSWLADYIAKWIRWSEEYLVQRIPVADILFGVMGLMAGLSVAFLLASPISVIPIPIVQSILPIIVSALLGYLGFSVGFKKRDELLSIFTSFGRSVRDKKNQAKLPVEHKILDTSVIIDGRIADICKTGFIEGTLVIPEFVLEELQHIADSSDSLKRNRGRRGLDILNKIQKELQVRVLVYEGDFEEIQEVDSKLVKLAKVLQGTVITNDFNLNKVCELQEVPVLNINDLANAVKPVVLPGEEIKVQVIKDGKEHDQGVAYLDDGTMIVVEGGRNYIGDYLDVLVTSVLQTSAGRMIFAKPKLLEKAL